MEVRTPAKMPPLLLLLTCASWKISSVSANNYTVGDEKAWNPGVNYTLWVNKHRPFYVGDWLVFYYTNGMADVVQVDETAYDECDGSLPISNYSKGQSYAFELNETKRYYFMCGYGHCYQGMKLSVIAHPLPPPSSPPPSKPSTAALPLSAASLPWAIAAVALTFAALIRLLL